MLRSDLISPAFLDLSCGNCPVLPHDFEILTDGKVHRYILRENDRVITYERFLTLLVDHETFRVSFAEILSHSPFHAFRWETPPVTDATRDRDFEFVLVNSPGLNRPPSRREFAQKFREAEREKLSVIAFPNLGRNAVMVVPCPVDQESQYTHFAAFLRHAPQSQASDLLSLMGREMKRQIGPKPKWLSTAGGGVAWLHVRIDKTPKYYHHRDYCQ